MAASEPLLAIALLLAFGGVARAEDESLEYLDHRIQSNENLIARYRDRIVAVFDRLLEDEKEKYLEQAAQDRSDMDFYMQEIADGEKRLDDLRARRRLLVARRLSTFEPRYTMDRAPVGER